MVIRLFRSNHPSAFIYLILFSILILVLPIHFNYNFDVHPSQSPLFLLIQEILQRFEFFYILFWITVILFQAILFNIILEKNSYIISRSHIPALIYVILCSLLLYIPNSNAVLLANTPILLALSKLPEIKGKQAYSVLFSSSIWISLSVLFYFPYILFFFWLVFTQWIFQSLSLRSIFITIIGFIIPFIYLFFSYYMWSDISKLSEFFVLPKFNTSLLHFQSTKNLYQIVSGVLTVINILAGYYFIKWFLRSITSIKKGAMAIGALSVVGILQIVLAFQSPKLILIPLVFLSSFITTHYILVIKKKFLLEIVFSLILAGIVIIQILT